MAARAGQTNEARLNRTAPEIRSIAKQLIGREISASSTEKADLSATFQAIEKLRPQLSLLMGRGGFQALLARALALASSDVPWLASVQVAADGELEGLQPALASLSAAEFAEGELVLLTQLIGLLVAFIGPALTRRLFIQIWPQLSLNDADFGGMENNEKAK